MSALSDTLHCARHPNTETVLHCGRCDTPICPRCLVGTPVGARCPTCARVKRFNLVLKPRDLVRTIAAGIGVGALGTVVAFAIVVSFLGPLISFAIVGFGVGHAVLVAANRRRVPELGPIALACLFFGYLLGYDLLLIFNIGGIRPEQLLQPLLVLANIRNIMGSVLLGLLVGGLLAWMRVR